MIDGGRVDRPLGGAGERRDERRRRPARRRLRRRNHWRNHRNFFVKQLHSGLPTTALSCMGGCGEGPRLWQVPSTLASTYRLFSHFRFSSSLLMSWAARGFSVTQRLAMSDTGERRRASSGPDAGCDGTVRLFDVNTRALVASLDCAAAGAAPGDAAACVRFDGGNQAAYVLTASGMLLEWDLRRAGSDARGGVSASASVYRAAWVRAWRTCARVCASERSGRRAGGATDVPQ